MKGQAEFTACEASGELKTECRLLPPLAPPVSVQAQRYRTLWKRAFMKLKMDRTVKRIGDEILLFGTQNELLDQNMQYKANIDELIDKKARKQENFRVCLDKDSTPQTFRCLLAPASRFKTCWNLVLCFILTYTAFVMPWRIAFETLVFWDEWAVFELAVDILFFADVVINFFTVLIESDGTMISDHWKVAKRYLTSWFLVDVTACIPFPLIEYLVGVDEGQRSEKYNSLMRLFRLPRLYKLFRITRVLRMFRTSALAATTDKLTEFLQANMRFAKLGKFLLACSVCVHVAACLWFFLARVSNFDPQSWIAYFRLCDEDQWTQYLIAVYWAVTTVTTVGYGDLHPVSDVERVFCVVWMLFGVGFYSFIIGSLSSLLTTIDSRESVIQAKLAAVEEFAAETKISKELKRKIHKEVRRNAHDRGLVWSDKYSLLTELPKSLRFEVASTMYDGIYRTFPLLSSKNTAFVSYVMPRLRPSSYESDEFLFREGDYADAVYFICEGCVNLVTAESGVVYKSFIRGSYVGEIEVVFSQLRVSSAQCFGECELLLMTRKDLLDVLKEFPSEAKMIQKLAQERQKKNASAYRETVRLLELKREKGTLQHLAGQARLSNIEEVEETDEECRPVASEYLIHRVTDITQEVADMKRMAERLAGKISELQCDAARMVDCRPSPRDLLEHLRRRVPSDAPEEERLFLQREHELGFSAHSAVSVLSVITRNATEDQISISQFNAIVDALRLNTKELDTLGTPINALYLKLMEQGKYDAVKMKALGVMLGRGSEKAELLFRCIAREKDTVTAAQVGNLFEALVFLSCEALPLLASCSGMGDATPGESYDRLFIQEFIESLRPGKSRVIARLTNSVLRGNSQVTRTVFLAAFSTDETLKGLQSPYAIRKTVRNELRTSGSVGTGVLIGK